MWLWIWVIVAVIAIVGEVLTTDLVMGSIAVAAGVAAVLALGLPVVAQLAAFAAISVVGIGAVRPALKHALGIEGAQLAGPVTHPHIEGRRAVVTQPVSADGGQILVGQGDYWTARAFDPEQRMETGTDVDVLLVDGLTALVAPTEMPSLHSPSQSQVTG